MAAICHGPWTLVEADVVRGRKLTSWPSLKTDLRNAGAEWTDSEVVVDRNLISSRKPDDIPAFNREILKLFGQGKGTSRAQIVIGVSAKAGGTENNLVTIDAYGLTPLRPPQTKRTGRRLCCRRRCFTAPAARCE